jgi:hypothetical protein
MNTPSFVQCACPGLFLPLSNPQYYSYGLIKQLTYSVAQHFWLRPLKVKDKRRRFAQPRWRVAEECLGEPLIMCRWARENQ